MAFLFVVGVFQLEVGNPVTVTLLKGFAVGRCDIQITQQAVVNAVGPAVNGILPAFPRLLHNGGVAQVIHLFHDVQFTQGIQTALLWHFAEQ